LSKTLYSKDERKLAGRNGIPQEQREFMRAGNYAPKSDMEVVNTEGKMSGGIEKKKEAR